MNGSHDDAVPHAVEEESCQPVENVEEADDDEKGQPGPDGQIHFLVEDVLRKDAKAVVMLLAAGRANVRHGATDLGREDLAHWVHVHFLFFSAKTK